MPSRWSTSREQPTHCVACPGPIMKCLIKSWLRPSKRLASVTFPPGASKIYSLSIFTHGRARRSALKWSRRRVSSFSRLSRSLRATSQSVRDTISWSESPLIFSDVIICVLIFCLPLLSSFFIRTTNERILSGHLLSAPITSPRYPKSYPARLIDLTFSREAEQRKAVWRWASHRIPKRGPIAFLRAHSLGINSAKLRRGKVMLGNALVLGVAKRKVGKFFRMQYSGQNFDTVDNPRAWAREVSARIN